MPNIIDEIEEIKRLDSQHMLQSIELLGKQIEQVRAETAVLKLPASYKKIRSIVFLGMGGSTLGAHCIKSVFDKELRVPVEIVNNYSVPKHVNSDTLVFANSYSGTTEEPLAALEKARKQKAKVVIVTSGGELAERAKKYHLPALVFSTDNNPCGSPRMGLGYTNFGPLFILAKLGLVKVGEAQVKKILETVKKYKNAFGVAALESVNPAKQLAARALLGEVWFVGSSHLAGSVHIVANQMNENAKRFAGYFLIPELNHHLLEGLSHPKERNGVFVFIESELYDARIQKRFAVTKEILQKNNVSFVAYRCREKTELLQAVELLVLGSYLSFYTAMLEGIDPTAIPTVNYLKAALKAK